MCAALAESKAVTGKLCFVVVWLLFSGILILLNIDFWKNENSSGVMCAAPVSADPLAGPNSATSLIANIILLKTIIFAIML